MERPTKMFQCSRVPFVETKLHKCKSALGYYCGDIQTGKLQEFNEALKEKKGQYHGLKGGRALAVSYILIWNRAAIIDWM